MKSRARFLTAAQVYEAFPTAADDVGQPAGEVDPHDYLAMLAAVAPIPSAVCFAAYFLPKREAVWWACATVRATGAVAPTDEEVIAAAETWVRSPDDENRRAALSAAMAADGSRPATWTAFAAGFSGGSIGSAEFQAVPPAPHLTAKAVNGAVGLALALAPHDQRDGLAASALDHAKRLALAADGRT